MSVAQPPPPPPPPGNAANARTAANAANAARSMQQTLQRVLPEAIAALATLAERKREAAEAYAKVRNGTLALVELARRNADETSRVARAEDATLVDLIETLDATASGSADPAARARVDGLLQALQSLKARSSSRTRA